MNLSTINQLSLVNSDELAFKYVSFKYIIALANMEAAFDRL